jgi:hypothetical protein
MIKHKVKEYTGIRMELHILGNGMMISSMVTVMKNGLMMQNIKDISHKVLNKAMELFYGLTVVVTMANSNRITSKVLVVIYGLIKESMKAFGKIIKCMVEEFLHGQMVEDMKANI